MNIEDQLNDLASASEYVEYYSTDCIDDAEREIYWMDRRAKIQQEIIDYVQNLEKKLDEFEREHLD